MSDSNPEPRLYRFASMKGFLPLSEEASISTRGQKLPALISNRSSTNLNDLRRDVIRRQSNFAFQSAEADTVLGRRISLSDDESGFSDPSERRMSLAAKVLNTPEMRSQRLIGNSNPRYRWEQYYKSDEELMKMTKPLRAYYERNNYLIQQYIYIDRLLDSSLPHDLIREYNQLPVDIPSTIQEESGASSPHPNGTDGASPVQKVVRTPKNLYHLPPEERPLLAKNDRDAENGSEFQIPEFVPDEDEDSGARVVTVAIYINLAANTVLLILKIITTLMTSSVSVLASLVDAALDMLSTGIIWTTTHLISSDEQDYQNYPVGRRRLEPIGVLVFSVIMITSFVQVGLEAFSKLTGTDHEIVQLSPMAIAIMGSTVVIKFCCWLWCRLIRNSSVQALAQDAMTDVVFNAFSIVFPLIGHFASIWWLDPLGGLLLSLYVIIAWSRTSKIHILNLTGCAASADERNVLLYLTMRFAHTIKKIQGLAAYHAGDKLNVEVDIVLSEEMSLRDSHDLSESLQYVLESVPGVERAFVHADYKSDNMPNHMRQ